MGDEAACCGRGISERVVGDMVTVGVADDGPRSRLPGIEPEALLGKVDATLPEDGVGDQFRLLFGRGGAALEELVAKRAIGAEALAWWSGEDTGLAAGWARFFCIGVGACCGDLEPERLPQRRTGHHRLLGPALIGKV